jgi:hypothetical protein
MTLLKLSGPVLEEDIVDRFYQAKVGRRPRRENDCLRLSRKERDRLLQALIPEPFEVRVECIGGSDIYFRGRKGFAGCSDILHISACSTIFGGDYKENLLTVLFGQARIDNWHVKESCYGYFLSRPNFLSSYGRMLVSKQSV